MLLGNPFRIANEPDITLREELRLTGSLNAGGPDPIPLASILLRRWPNRHPGEMEFEAVVAPQDANTLEAAVTSRPYPLLVEGQVHADKPFRFRAEWRHISGNRTKGVADWLEIGKRHLDATPEHQWLAVYFTPTPLALSEPRSPVAHSTGELKVDDPDRDRQPPLQVPTALGTLQFAMRYRFEKATADSAQAVIRVGAPAATLDMSEDPRRDLLALGRHLIDEVEDFETVASFLGRRQMRWHALEIASRGQSDDGQKWWEEFLVFRNAYSTDAPRYPFVNALRLADNGIEELLEGYRAAKYNEPLKHAINFLLGRWQTRSIETGVISAFLAFETLVNGINRVDGTGGLIERESFRALAQELQTAIRDFGTEKQWRDSQISTLASRAGNMNRVSLPDRAVAVLNRFGAEWRDLWGSEADQLRTHIRDAYALRSKLLHAGQVDDYRALWLAGARIYSLTERLILLMIDGDPQSLVDPRAYRFVHGELDRPVWYEDALAQLFGDDWGW